PIFFAVVLGYYGDRSNRVKITVATAVVWGITAVISGLAPVLLVLAPPRVLGGLGLLSAETIYPSLLADYYPPRVQGAVFGAYRTGAQGLLLIGGPLAGAIAAVFDWRAAFVLLALPTFVLAFVVTTVL